MAYVIAPHLFDTERMRVDVETASGRCLGQTVCDCWHYEKERPENVTVVTGMDVGAFWDLMLDAIAAI